MKKKAVLILSEYFPAKHKRAGEPTHFVEKIKNGNKIHTIRDNSQWWLKKIISIQSEQMYLSLRKWIGKPYYTGQIEFEKKYNVGWQPIVMIYTANDDFPRVWIDGNEVSVHDIAKNDGLSTEDFVEWFFGKSKSNVYAGCIIHFTDFRY